MAKGNILIIDDEPLILQGIKDLVEDSADNVLTALSGKEGLDILRKNTVHAVVCDINMPEMNGIQVIAQARTEKFEMPFIFFTAHGTRDIVIEATKHGIFGLVNKPNFEELCDVVPHALKEGLKMFDKSASPEPGFDDLLGKLDEDLKNK